MYVFRNDLGSSYCLLSQPLGHHLCVELRWSAPLWLEAWLALWCRFWLLYLEQQPIGFLRQRGLVSSESSAGPTWTAFGKGCAYVGPRTPSAYVGWKGCFAYVGCS